MEQPQFATISELWCISRSQFLRGYSHQLFHATVFRNTKTENVFHQTRSNTLDTTGELTTATKKSRFFKSQEARDHTWVPKWHKLPNIRSIYSQFFIPGKQMKITVTFRKSLEEHGFFGPSSERHGNVKVFLIGTRGEEEVVYFPG